MLRMLLIPVKGAPSIVDVGHARKVKEVLGVDVVERVRVGADWSIAVDESGSLRPDRKVNEVASVAYGVRRHGTLIYGNVLLGKEALTGEGPDMGIDWVDADESEIQACLAEILAERG